MLSFIEEIKYYLSFLGVMMEHVSQQINIVTSKKSVVMAQMKKRVQLNVTLKQTNAGGKIIK